MDKKIKQSITETPSNSYVAWENCTEESLNEIIGVLESKESLQLDEQEVLKVAKEIKTQRFGKEKAK
jgi:hypothetical protein